VHPFRVARVLWPLGFQSGEERRTWAVGFALDASGCSAARGRVFVGLAARLLGFAHHFYCCLISFNVSPQVSGEPTKRSEERRRSGEVVPTTGAYKQGCHIRRLSGKSRPKDVVRTRPDVPASGRTSESADRRRTARADGQLVGLADGTWWTAIGRHAVRHSIRRMAWQTAIRPPVARSNRRLDGGRPLHPPVMVAVGWPVDGQADSLADGLADPSAWAVRQKPSARVRPPSRNFGGP
jgi:hypothetical protein